MPRQVLYPPSQLTITLYRVSHPLSPPVNHIKVWDSQFFSYKSVGFSVGKLQKQKEKLYA